MKWIIIVINLLGLLAMVSALARQQKIIKKATRGTKPSKHQKSILDEFAGLSSDDTAFLKELDKQFKLHGDKIKIKVESDNTTTPKNSKRTIDGSLGYGYHQNQHENYYFTPPKYVVYPYSQHNIPAPTHQVHHREKATHIEIQPSHSYEIKEEINEEQHYGYRNAQNQQPHHLDYEEQADPVPVIVLRVPGPTKYALHLQALLQQYLELRAAQFLKVLEEQDHRGLLMHPQHYVQQMQPQVTYIPMVSVHQPYNQYYHNQNYQQQQYYRAQENYYHQQQALQHQAIQQEPQHIHVAEIQHYEEPHQQQNYEEEAVYEQPKPFENFVTTPSYQAYEEHIEEHHTTADLPTNENYPSDQHTRVVFKKKVVPTIPSHQERYEPQIPEEEYSDPVHKEYSSQEAVVSITQRSKLPFNYHAHASTISPSTRTAKRNAPYTQEEFKKLNKVVQKMKRQRGTVRSHEKTTTTTAKP